MFSFHFSLYNLLYRKLSETVGRIGNMLKNSGVKAGDRVTIYLSNSPFAVATMLACARIGAVHNVVFAGFSADALASRINNGESFLLKERN